MSELNQVDMDKLNKIVQLKEANNFIVLMEDVLAGCFKTCCKTFESSQLSKAETNCTLKCIEKLFHTMDRFKYRQNQQDSQ
jgi:hypothetical protein